MKTLNAKQEAIKKAYGEYWDLVKDLVRTDGSLSEPVWRGSDINIDYDDFSTGYFRPKSLQGIENNNGWIKIESEADLPKEGIHHSILLDSDCINGYRNYDVIVFYEVNSRYRKKEISHYQPIEKPKPPIY